VTLAKGKVSSVDVLKGIVNMEAHSTVRNEVGSDN
jgi:hypothetical protein